jgi:5-methylcytosine-specific restriction endonuclease McrA
VCWRARSAASDGVDRSERGTSSSDLTQPERVEHEVHIRHRLLPPRLLAVFRNAVILDRSDYRCAYCQRSAEEVWQESGGRRTLYFEVDHRSPRMLGGQEYALKNCCAACLVCNGAKRSWPIPVFMEELRSIASALGRPNR